METVNKKITRATFLKFIRDNKDNLFTMAKSDFDPMTDCVQQVDMIPYKVNSADINFEKPNTLGIAAIWLVGRSRDYFSHYEDEMFVGIKVVNCCGSSIVARMK